MEKNMDVIMKDLTPNAFVLRQSHVSIAENPNT